MTTDALLAKWSDLLSRVGREIRIRGALRIDEPEKIMRDLRNAGYEGSGRPDVFNNGSRLYRRWRPSNQPTEREKLVAAGLVPDGQL